MKLAILALEGCMQSAVAGIADILALSNHAALPGPRQIEMPLLRTHQKIPTVVPVFNQMLGRIIVTIEDRDLAVVLHRAVLSSHLCGSVRRMGRAKRNPSLRARSDVMGFAEFIIGPRVARTRWLYPSYLSAPYALSGGFSRRKRSRSGCTE